MLLLIFASDKNNMYMIDPVHLYGHNGSQSAVQIMLLSVFFPIAIILCANLNQRI